GRVLLEHAEHGRGATPGATDDEETGQHPRAAEWLASRCQAPVSCLPGPPLPLGVARLRLATVRRPGPFVGPRLGRGVPARVRGVFIPSRHGAGGVGALHRKFPLLTGQEPLAKERFSDAGQARQSVAATDIPCEPLATAATKLEPPASALPEPGHLKTNHQAVRAAC